MKKGCNTYFEMNLISSKRFYDLGVTTALILKHFCLQNEEIILYLFEFNPQKINIDKLPLIIDYTSKNGLSLDKFSTLELNDILKELYSEQMGTIPHSPFSQRATQVQLSPRFENSVTFSNDVCYGLISFVPLQKKIISFD